MYWAHWICCNLVYYLKPDRIVGGTWYIGSDRPVRFGIKNYSFERVLSIYLRKYRPVRPTGRICANIFLNIVLRCMISFPFSHAIYLLVEWKCGPMELGLAMFKSKNYALAHWRVKFICLNYIHTCPIGINHLN